MYRLYPLLFYIGLVGALSILGTAASPRLGKIQPALTAVWVTYLTVIWLLVPYDLRWLFSLWSPLSLFDGALLVDLTPAFWKAGAVIGLALSGVAWVEAVEHRRSSPVGHTLAIFLLLVIWLAISSGSLLLTLIAWAIFDLLLAAGLLLNGGEGEAVSFTLMLNGFTTLLLWAAALISGREGISLLWRTMWPIPSVSASLFLAALIRMGFYPFQLVFLHRRGGRQRLLQLATMLQPMLGLALLGRLLTMPGRPSVPSWFVVLALTTMAWGAVRSLADGMEGWYGAHYGLVGGWVLGALVAYDASALMAAAGTWIATLALLLLHRGIDRRRLFVAWPIYLAMLALLGVPPSPIGELYRAAIFALPIGGKVVYLVLLALLFVPLLRKVAIEAPGSVLPPWPHWQLALLVGMTLPMAAILAVGWVAPPVWMGITLWGASFAVAVACIRFADRLPLPVQIEQHPLVDFFAWRWFYRALWRGWDHALASVRAAAAIVEGQGALIWSLLIVLVTMLVVVVR